MVKLMVLYGKPEDPSAFDAHYAAGDLANFASGGVTMFVAQV